MLEALPRVVPVEDEEISAELDKTLPQEGHSDLQVEQSAVGEEGRQGRHGHLQGQGRKDANHPGGESVDRRRPPSAHGKLRPRETKAKVERGFIDTNGRYMETDEPGCTPSATSSRDCRNWRTPRRWKASSPSATWRASSRRSTASAARTPRIASRRWIDRPDGKAGARSGLRGEDRQVPVSRQQQGDDSRQA